MSDFAPDSKREAAIEAILKCTDFALIVEIEVDSSDEEIEIQHEKERQFREGKIKYSGQLQRVISQMPFAETYGFALCTSGGLMESVTLEDGSEIMPQSRL